MAGQEEVLTNTNEWFLGYARYMFYTGQLVTSNNTGLFINPSETMAEYKPPKWRNPLLDKIQTLERTPRPGGLEEAFYE